MASQEDYLEGADNLTDKQISEMTDESGIFDSVDDDAMIRQILNDDTDDDTKDTSVEDLLNNLPTDLDEMIGEESFDTNDGEEDEDVIPEEVSFSMEESSDGEFEENSESLPEDSSDNEEIPTEEFIDMDEIDALLSDVSEIHPERNLSSTELEERIAQYEKDPEAAENALMGEDGSVASDDSNETETVETDADDFLSNLENVDELLADVESKAKAEEEELKEKRALETDGDLDEINDLLNKSDNNEAVNDDLLSMIEGLDNDIPDTDEDIDEEKTEEKEEKPKKEKKEKKKKKKGNKESDNSESEEKEADGKSKEKKGLFAKLLGFMFDSDEDEEEEGSEGGEKDKKAGKGKNKKGAKANDNASIEAELEEEDKKSKKNKKDKKDKKDKKEKKEKKPKASKGDKKQKEETEEKQKSSIKTRGIIFAALFCMTVLAIVLVIAVLVPKNLAKKEARAAYYAHDYETASNKLYGMKLNDSDRLIYEKASLLYRIELFVQKADAYKVMGDDLKRLDALLQTWNECNRLSVDARLLSITEEMDDYRNRVTETIAAEYNISEEDIKELCDMKPVYYTIAIEKIIANEDFKEAMPDNGNEIKTESGEDTELPEADEEEIPDLLPEEQE